MGSESSPLNLRLRARPTPIYVIGDSHSLIFNDLLFEESQLFQQHFITRAKYGSTLNAASYMHQAHLNPRLLQFLRDENLVDDQLNAFHCAMSDLAGHVARAMDRARMEPILLFFAGDIDLRSLFLKQIGPRADFVLPFLNDAHPDAGAVAGAELMPYKLARQRVEGLLTPFFKALLTLQKAGFQRLFVHSLPPQTLSDADYARINGYASPLQLRYKATLLFNDVLAQYCQTHQIFWINIWERVTIHGRLNPAYHLDHVHLNRKAAEISMQTLFESLAHSYRSALAPQYLRYREQARRTRPLRQRDAALQERYRQEHVLRFPAVMPQPLLESLRQSLNYDRDTNNREHYRLDWVGNALEAYSEHIFAARPTPSVLRQIFEFLFFSPVRTLLENCVGSAFTVSCCRFFRTEVTPQAQGPQCFHRDNLPPGAVRALIYLTDVDQASGPFEYQDPESGDPHCVLGPAGTLLIFDADAVTHRGSPPTEHTREVIDLVLLPAIVEIEQQVIWPGMNHWPVDPYHYSLKGYLSYPDLGQAPLSVDTPNSTERQAAEALLKELLPLPAEAVQARLHAEKHLLQLPFLPLAPLLELGWKLFQVLEWPAFQEVWHWMGEIVVQARLEPESKIEAETGAESGQSSGENGAEAVSFDSTAPRSSPHSHLSAHPIPALQAFLGFLWRDEGAQELELKLPLELPAEAWQWLQLEDLPESSAELAPGTDDVVVFADLENDAQVAALEQRAQTQREREWIALERGELSLPAIAQMLPAAKALQLWSSSLKSHYFWLLAAAYSQTPVSINGQARTL